MFSQSDSTVLLLGGSGVLGAELALALGSKRVHATHFSRPFAGSLAFDVQTMSLDSLLARLPQRPAHAILMAGITSLDLCARDPLGTAQVNVTALVRLIDELVAREIRPVFISSDAVFDGSRSWWSESDVPNPVMTYGRQKLAVERHLSVAAPNGLVLRCPKLLEAEGREHGFLSGWIQSLGRAETIRCAMDQFFTPASARDVATAIVRLLAREARGLYHLAGRQRLSRRDLLAEVLAEYRRHAQPLGQILDCRLHDLAWIEPPPLDTSMSSVRLAEDHGIQLGDAATAARSLVQQHFQMAA